MILVRGPRLGISTEQEAGPGSDGGRGGGQARLRGTQRLPFPEPPSLSLRPLRGWGCWPFTPWPTQSPTMVCSPSTMSSPGWQGSEAATGTAGKHSAAVRPCVWALASPLSGFEPVRWSL